MNEFAERIIVDSGMCGRRPCIRRMRIRVSDVLDLLADLTPEQILNELPDLERENIFACLRFAGKHIDYPVVAM